MPFYSNNPSAPSAGGQPWMGGSWAGNNTSQQQPGSAPQGTYNAPPDGSIYAAEQYAMAERAYESALARFNQQRTGLLQQNGYAGDLNAKTGMLQNLRVDPKSLYGNLQEMLHGQALEDQSATYGAQDRNLVGGLANQASSELSYQHHGQTTSLANTLLGNLSDINSQQIDAKAALNDALWQLQHQAASTAIQSGNFNPADAINQAAAGGHQTAAPTFQPSYSGPTAAQTMERMNPGGYNELQKWSQAMNAKYGSRQLASHVVQNAYKTNRNKRG